MNAEMMDYPDPTISVVVPTYNRADLIRRTINSILDQSYSNFELIVVDDASTDNTQAIVEKYDDPRIQYIRKKENEGGAAARNTGIRNSHSEFIAFCDSDDEWTKNKLEKQLTKVRQNNCVAVYCRNYIYKDKYDVFRESDGELKSGKIYSDLLQGWCPTSTSLFLVQRSALESVGGFDPDLPSFQDYDLWIRLAKKYSFCYIDDCLVIKHDHEKGQLATSPEIRSNGLDKFLNKWETEIEQEHNKKTVDQIRNKHLKQIYYNYSIGSRIDRKYKQSLIYLNKYINVSSNNYSIKNIFHMLFVFMAGNIGHKLLQSVYYPLFWQRGPIESDNR